MKTPVAILILVSFIFTGIIGPVPAHALDEFRLPTPGVMVPLSPQFNPAILKGIKIHPDNPFKFDFILDRGDSLPLAGRVREGDIKQEATKLIKYFLASLTIPEKDLWVNLSPYEKNRIIPQAFGQTAMGRDLLAEDYMLKQITASLIYPEGEVGRKFWKRIYEEAAQKFGTTDIPVNTFNKVWIVPEKAVVYENAKAGTAYVIESKLKVMLEQDYLALSHTVIPAQAGIHNKNDINAIGSQIVRAIVIPELTKEVNEGKNFTQLRQVYNSLILADWYKKKIRDSILSQVYENKNKVSGILSSPNALVGDPEQIYQRYLEAFKKGAYNYIKEEIDPSTQQVIPRKYFSGGTDLAMNSREFQIKDDPRLLPSRIPSMVHIEATMNADQAMKLQPARSTNFFVDGHANKIPVVDVDRQRLIRMTSFVGRLRYSNSAFAEILREVFGHVVLPVVYDFGIGWSRDNGPITVKELADYLTQEAHVVGIDNQIPDYQVETPNGLALFNSQGNVLSWIAKNYFSEDKLSPEVRQYLNDIFEKINHRTDGFFEVSDEHNSPVQVIYDPIRFHERDNLEYVSGNIFDLQTAKARLSPHKANIVRVANLIYPHYGASAIPKALKAMSNFVDEGGLVFIGTAERELYIASENYLVYQKRGNSFHLIQYAFSADVRTSRKLKESIEKDVRSKYMQLIPEFTGRMNDSTFAAKLAAGLKKAGVPSETRGPMVFVDMKTISEAREATLANSIYKLTGTYFGDFKWQVDAAMNVMTNPVTAGLDTMSREGDTLYDKRLGLSPEDIEFFESLQRARLPGKNGLVFRLRYDYEDSLFSRNPRKWKGGAFDMFEVSSQEGDKVGYIVIAKIHERDYIDAYGQLTMAFNNAQILPEYQGKGFYKGFLDFLPAGQVIGESIVNRETLISMADTLINQDNIESIIDKVEIDNVKTVLRFARFDFDPEEDPPVFIHFFHQYQKESKGKEEQFLPLETAFNESILGRAYKSYHLELQEIIFWQDDKNNLTMNVDFEKNAAMSAGSALPEHMGIIAKKQVIDEKLGRIRKLTAQVIRTRIDLESAFSRSGWTDRAKGRLFRSLEQNGYIDSDKKLEEAFLNLKGGEQIELPRPFNSKSNKREVYELLRIADTKNLQENNILNFSEANQEFIEMMNLILQSPQQEQKILFTYLWDQKQSLDNLVSYFNVIYQMRWVGPSIYGVLKTEDHVKAFEDMKRNFFDYKELLGYETGGKTSFDSPLEKERYEIAIRTVSHDIWNNLLPYVGGFVSGESIEARRMDVLIRRLILYSDGRISKKYTDGELLSIKIALEEMNKYIEGLDAGFFSERKLQDYNRVRDLVGDLLSIMEGDISRRRSSVSLKEVIEQAFEMARHTRGLGFEVQDNTISLGVRVTDARINARINADRRKMVTIFSTLFKNSFQVWKERNPRKKIGNLRIRIDLDRRYPGRIIVEFRDNVGGISDPELLKIPDPGQPDRQAAFFMNVSRRKGDTGLGLAMVYHLMHLHGYGIRIENVEKIGKDKEKKIVGARFILDLTGTNKAMKPTDAAMADGMMGIGDNSRGLFNPHADLRYIERDFESSTGQKKVISLESILDDLIDGGMTWEEWEQGYQKHIERYDRQRLNSPLARSYQMVNNHDDKELKEVILSEVKNLFESRRFIPIRRNASRRVLTPRGWVRVNQAMAHADNGGIDLTSNKAMTIQNNGQSIRFHIDAAQLAQLQNASGFTPVITDMEPMTDLRGFLEISEYNK